MSAGFSEHRLEFAPVVGEVLADLALSVDTNLRSAMPRRRIGAQPALPIAKAKLAEALAAELKSGREFGQPIIYERECPTGKVRVIIVWDEWAEERLEARSAVILKAYEIAEGNGAREKIALASGLTVSEATAAGMLPYQIIAALRKGDPVTPEQVRAAFSELGASTAGYTDEPQLRFATEAEAQSCRQRLIERFPGSDEVWLVRRDSARQEFEDGMA